MPVTFPDALTCWKQILKDAESSRHLLSEIEGFARENNSTAEIVFGTSGWRGEIGTDFTFNNLRIVTESIIDVFREEMPEVMAAVGVSGFDEVRRRGIIVGHDNRFLGESFAMEVLGRLQAAGIKTWYAGEATTPEFSTGIAMLKAACSINLTPSHNPANYAGFKLNPSDGGPAGPEITTHIERIANRYMADMVIMKPLSPANVEQIDLTALYIQFLTQRGTIKLDLIKDFLSNQDCLICVDNMHGSSRNRIQRILGESCKIVYLRTNDDYLFGGVAPEPSEKNMRGIEEILSGSGAEFKIGAIMDPDGDRIRYSDGRLQISMNYFGAMALEYFYKHRGFRGVAVKSVATSNLVNAIAAQLNIPLRETMVGFKNFRPYLLPNSVEKALVAFEESDGISGYNHIPEKDSLFGLLLALEMVATMHINLSDYLGQIMNTYGHFYPDRSGISVDRSLSGKPLLDKLASIKTGYTVGTTLAISGQSRVVAELIAIDGIKLVLDDASWLMIRPSGTEPKVRFYVESRTEETVADLFSTAERITKEALS